MSDQPQTIYARSVWADHLGRFVVCGASATPHDGRFEYVLKSATDARLAEDASLLLDAYKALLVLHRVMDKHGLAAGALAAENMAGRIVAAHPEIPSLCAIRRSAQFMKGGDA